MLEGAECSSFNPCSDGGRVKTTFWGVRGSIPVPGVDASRWGGNSSCVEICAPGASPLVLDLGSGCRNLGKSLLSRCDGQFDILLTHFHLDHVLGFPFFPAIFAPSFQIGVHVPVIFGSRPEEYFSWFLNSVFHPLRLPQIPARLDFSSVQQNRPFQLGQYTVMASPLVHPGGAYGYRIEHGGHSIAYITDTAPFALPGEGVAAGHLPTGSERKLLNLIQGVDLIIFDTMFTFDEYLERMDWGHSYPEYAVAIARAAEARQLVMFHHAPDATDDFMDELAARWSGNQGPQVVVAREGGSVDLEG